MESILRKNCMLNVCWNLRKKNWKYQSNGKMAFDSLLNRYLEYFHCFLKVKEYWTLSPKPIFPMFNAPNTAALTDVVVYSLYLSFIPLYRTFEFPCALSLVIALKFLWLTEAPSCTRSSYFQPRNLDDKSYLLLDKIDRPEIQSRAPILLDYKKSSKFQINV